eukprot:symbB.v1.2.031787.t1/scaffold3728.1/size51370/2
MSPPRCTCGAVRCFEMQLMPTLPSRLADAAPKEKAAALMMEWGTLVVFTCSKDCPCEDPKEEASEASVKPDPAVAFPMSENAEQRKPGLLDSDKDFPNFVGRMVHGAMLKDYSEEQLWQVIEKSSSRRRLAILQKCRGKQGRLDATCFCKEACGDEYVSLANCVRSSSAESCQEYVAALTGCVRDEWKAFLMSSSPSLQNDALQRIEKFVEPPAASTKKMAVAGSSIPCGAMAPLAEVRSLQRTFLVPFASIPCWPQVDPDRLAGSHRLDVFCRSLAAALGQRPRKDSSFLAAFAKPSWTRRIGMGLLESLDGQPPAGAAPIGVVEVVGGKSQDVFLEERPTAQRLKHLLQQQTVPGWRCWEEASMRSLLLKLLKDLQVGGGKSVRLFVLQEEAAETAEEALAQLAVQPKVHVDHVIFVIGDHIGLRPMAFGRLVNDFGAKAVSLPTAPLLTSQCITVLQYLVDRSLGQASAERDGPKRQKVARDLLLLSRTLFFLCEVVVGQRYEPWMQKSRIQIQVVSGSARTAALGS